MSGRVQEGPWSPPDPIKKYLIFRKILYFSTYIFLLPIVLPIVLPIELPINRLGGRYVSFVFVTYLYQVLVQCTLNYADTSYEANSDFERCHQKFGHGGSYRRGVRGGSW